jgi:hypothetical protein
MKIIGHAQMKAVTRVARIPVFLLLAGDKAKGHHEGGVICFYGILTYIYEADLF